MIIMNQIFKVVYSAAKQCYVVTSEFAKSNGKKAAIVAAALVLTSGVGAVNAADDLASRVDALEGSIHTINTALADINNTVNNTSDEQVAKNKQKSEANEAAITALTNKVSTLEAGAGTAGTKDQEQDTKIQTNTDKVAAHDTAINNLTPKVTKNAEDLAKVDNKIDGAREAAVTEAGRKAAEKINEAKTDLETKIGTAKTEAIADAEGKIATAKTEAITEAGTKAAEKITEAKTDLETKIGTAKTEAIADAEGKIATAKTEAIADAESKVNAAKQTLEAKDTELAGKITTAEGKITDLEAKYNSATDIKAANERFEKLEKYDKDHDKQITTINGAIAKANSDLSDLKNDVDGNAEAIDNNTTAINKNTDEIDAAKKLLVAHDARIGELEKAADETVGDIAANAEGIKDNADKIKLVGEALKETTKAIGDLDTKIGEETTKAKTEAIADAEGKVNAAKTDLETKIGTAKTEAIADAEGKVNAAKTDLEGKISTAKTEAIDAAEGKVNAAKTDLEGKIGTAKTEAIAAAESKVNAAKLDLETKFKGLDNTTVKLEKYDKDIAALQETEKAHDARITAVEKDVKVVGANAAALAALKPLQYNPGQTTQIMAGVGTYRGQSAVALGAAHYTSENLMYHAGVSFGNGSGTMANAGVTIGFGSGETAKAESPKVAQLQSAVDRLTAENEQVKAALYDIYAKLQAK